MPEVEFRAWAQFAERRLLPQRRVELYLAQIAHTIAAYLGSRDSPPKLSDFILKFDAEDTPVEDLKAALGFTPRNRKDGKQPG